MLTDPFIETTPKYSTTETGVVEFSITSSYVTAGLAIKSMLESAGWTVESSSPSTVSQWRPGWYVLVSDGLGTPVAMTPEQCNSIDPNPQRVAIVNERRYQMYDPYKVTPTCAGGTGNITWVAAGVTQADSHTNLAAAIDGGSPFDVTLSGPVDGIYTYALTSKSSGFENDEVGIFIGGSLNPSTRGYYILQSPTLASGGYLQCKLRTEFVAGAGYSFTYGDIGVIRIVMTIYAAGGGSYEQPMFPGDYYFAGCNHQFLIVPRLGASIARNAGSSILASLIEPPEEHDTAGNCPLVVGSDNGQMTSNTDQLRRCGHWGVSLACGHSLSMASTYRGAVGTEWYKIVTILARGTVGRPTLTRAGQPLLQAPYVALPANPNAGAEAVIGGKLWDMMITSGNAQIGARMMYDGKQWVCVSSTAEPFDVCCDLWVLAA